MGEPVTTASALDAYVAARGPLVEQALEEALPGPHVHPAVLHQAMRYSLFAGGKRIRPILVLATAEVADALPQTVLPTACAVELIHTYSLIHDDLPSMDNSATRRGQPTCHVAFGEALAVLAGDALHALAFELIARNASLVDPERAVAALDEIARAIGTQGMVGGQILDLLAEGRPTLARFGQWPADRRQGVQAIHRWKTGALIRACVRAGARLAGADGARLNALTGYGEDLGLAFQIIDDVLDEVGSTQALGKDAGRDAASSKLTYPAAFGLDSSRQAARLHTDRAIAALASFGEEADVLRDLASTLLVREA